LAQEALSASSSRNAEPSRELEVSVTDELTTTDFAVLPHLRGFPDDLERYANLMKQAHPRGKSAVATMIQRPGADSFLRRVALAVHNGEQILTTVAAAERLGVTPAELLRRLDAGELPPPLFREGRKVIWRTDQLTASAHLSTFDSRLSTGPLPPTKAP
jgi:ATP-dependent Clp protease adapter protein ClpS